MSKLIREDVVEAWIYGGIMDFYIAFFMENKRFYEYAAFCYHQGIEKTCKAYLLGARSAEYEALQEKEAEIKVDKIAKDKKMGHNLRSMIDRLIFERVLEEGILTKKYYAFDSKYICGSQVIESLEKAYLESRYPVPYATHEKHPLGDLPGYWDPITSHIPGEFACEIGLEIIRGIESRFDMSISKDKIINAIDGADWIMFRRTFFKDTLA